jgi:hypothetical protein
MLVKISPEDVIAVPYGEPNKMRVAGYHIVAKLPKEGDALVRADKPMTTDSESAKLLANVIAGNHVGITERVVIGAAMGESIKTLAVAGADTKPIPNVPVAKLVHALDSEEAGNVSIKDLRKRADKAIVEQRTAAQKAAASGDMSAAISAPEVPASKPAAKPESKKAAAKQVTTEKKAEPKTVVLAEKLPEKHTLALVLHAEGKSNRQIEAELHICRKTLKKLFDKNGLKPNG